MIMIQNDIVNTDTINIESVKKNMDNNSSSIHRKYNNSGYKTIKFNCNGNTGTLMGKFKKVADDC